ncbi:hypothetical protein [Tardiphaga sp.]|uniref:hypothetical protein n=1 Tax=Tardiphaga sp. TaxID=1926292 RepID=UPI00352A6EC2
MRKLGYWSASILILTLDLASCSTKQGDESRHDGRSVPGLIGEQIYACQDGSEVDVDFLTDGLTLDFSVRPAGKAERLTAPATGLTFIGDKINIKISGGDSLTILRTGAQPLLCQRIKSASTT